MIKDLRLMIKDALEISEKTCMLFIHKSLTLDHYSVYIKKYITIIIFIIIILALPRGPVLAQQPESDNYQLRNFGFGAGGATNTSSDNYSLFGTVGQLEIGSGSSTLYNFGGGLEYAINANVPPAPTFINPSSYYNRLHLTLNTGNNPTDAEFAISISTDNFASDRQYVQDDATVGNTLGIEDWQTYTDWGGASGFDIIGLTPDTTYTVEISSRHGAYTQGRWGPRASATTEQVALTFDIDVASSDTESAAPYTVDFGNLTSGSVTTASDRIWIDLSTNADNGGFVYIYATNGGLTSSTASYTISSATTNLASANEGFGLRSNSDTESAGGPLVAESPYDGTDENIGTTDTTIRGLYNSSGNPITGGRGSVLLKAKTSSLTPASSDYTEILTLIASGSF